jgi:general secretion pathway protein C
MLIMRKRLTIVVMTSFIATGVVSWGVLSREGSKRAETRAASPAIPRSPDARLGSQSDSRFDSLVLTGTVVGSGPSQGHALIRAGDDPPQLIAVGAMIMPAVKLTAVYHDHVLFDANGREHALWLTASSSPALRTETPEYDRRDLDEMFATRYSYEDGLHRGFEVFPGRDPRWLANLSLLPGDLVIAVNGEPLDQPESGAARLAALRNVEFADLTIVRFDEPQTMRVKIKGADVLDPEDGEVSADEEMDAEAR